MKLNHLHSLDLNPSIGAWFVVCKDQPHIIGAGGTIQGGVLRGRVVQASNLGSLSFVTVKLAESAGLRAESDPTLLDAPQAVFISPSMLPTEETVFFEHYSSSRTISDLPTADEIYAAAQALPGFHRHVSAFPSLSLAVKRVRRTSRHRAPLAEGQTL